MIIGVGTDIVQIPRVERLLQLYGQHFIRRILSDEEIAKLFSLNKNSHSNYLAKRFVAKEAISKAFGTGIGKDLCFKDISVLNDKGGKPFVKIASSPTDKFSQCQIYLSISDDYPAAISFVIVSKF